MQGQPPITAIFVHNDTLAVGVLSALAAAGYRVPGDVAVVGCDDVPLAEYLVPPLTTVHVPLAETGEQATDLLLRRIRGDPPQAAPLRLPVSLVVRASCGAHAVPTPINARLEDG